MKDEAHYHELLLLKAWASELSAYIAKHPSHLPIAWRVEGLVGGRRMPARNLDRLVRMVRRLLKK